MCIRDSYIYPEDGSGICDRYVLYFSSNYISRFSTPEVNLLECFLFRPGNQPVVLTVPDRQLDSFLSVLSRMEAVSYTHLDVYKRQK